MADFEPFSFDSTAFMSGQIGSKLWLCEELEQIVADQFARPVLIWYLGGWYGMINFLMRARDNISVGKAVSYDLDPLARRGALVLNETYELERSFDAITADVNSIDYDQIFIPDVVINTSTEHMDSLEWFERIPDGTLCVLQTNDMPHEDHIYSCSGIDDLKNRFPLRETYFAGSKFFDYTDWSFTRYMHIGSK